LTYLDLARRFFAISVLAAAAVLPSQSQILNQNLVQNPGAEDGPAANNFTDLQVASIKNWTTTGGFPSRPTGVAIS
jgi:hypothetical protein